MTRDEILDMVRDRAARPGSTDHIVALVREFNHAQATVLERGYPKPWFLLDVAEVVVDSTGYKAPTPTGFLELYEEDPAILLVSSDGSQLLPLEVTSRPNVEWGLSSPNTSSGVNVMEGWLLLGSKLPEGTVLRVLYYRAEPLNTLAYGEPNQPAPNRWMQYADDLLVGWLGMVYTGTYLRDDKAVPKFEGLYNMARQRLVAQNTSRKEAAQQRFFAGATYPIPEGVRTLTPLS